MILWFICGLLILGAGATEEFCEESPRTDFPKSVCYSSSCTNAIKSHIKHEFHAAFKYLYMGAVFGQYEVERPGMAKFFLESASEERGHAIQMLDYLNMRGVKYNKNYEFKDNMLWQPQPAEDQTKIQSALEEALKMEIDVTKKINNVVESCADDFHAADVFTNPILEEQHTGMRKLQGAIQTMKELQRGYGTVEHGINFAEYLFDQKMLNGEL